MEKERVVEIHTDVKTEKYSDVKNDLEDNRSELEKECMNKNALDIEEPVSTQQNVLQGGGDAIDESPSVRLADHKNQGNLLNSVVTMHMTNCDDDYSPTLAICDIFNKPKASFCENARSPKTIREEESKEEFLIIDLDTCQMEKGSKQQEKSKKPEESSTKTQNTPTSNGLILVNLSSEEIQSDFLNRSPIERNFKAMKDCDNSYDHFYNYKDENSNMGISTEERHISMENDMKIAQQMNDRTDKDFKHYEPAMTGNAIHFNFQNKEIPLDDLTIPNDSPISKEVYSPNMNFQSNGVDSSFQSKFEDPPDPVFHMPEILTRYFDGKVKSQEQMFSKQSSIDSSIGNDNSNDFNEYANTDSTLELSLLTNPLNSSRTPEFYDHHQSQSLPYYSVDDKTVYNIAALNTQREVSPTYGLLSHSQESVKNIFKTTTNETSASHKLPYYSTIQQHRSNPFFHSPYIPSFHTPYPYSLQHATDSNGQFLSSSLPNYCDWTTWNDSAIYEVSLNSAPINKIDSEYQQNQETWSADNLTDLYDPQIGMKSNVTDNDSEATEDADETGIPMFLDNPTDFPACDNLSNMSVMSGSCYSDSSVMTPFSPSDFTPPPSTSNTPVPPTGYHELSTFEENRFGGQVMKDNSTEPLQLFSPTMQSMTTYNTENEGIVQSLLEYGKFQSTKHHYPSMADIHNATRSGMSISSTSSKFEDNDISSLADYRTLHTHQIQSDKISTSTTRNAYNKKKWNYNFIKDGNEPTESFDHIRQEEVECSNQFRRSRHNEPLNQTAIRIMSQWYEGHLDNPYPTKDDKMRMAQDGGITITQVKSWFANKRNRTNNTKPKVQKRAMKEKLKKLFQDLKHSRTDSMDNSHIIQQLSGLIQT